MKTWRQLQRADLPECLRIDGRSSGESIIGRQRALAVWEALLADPAFGSAVIEAPTRSGLEAIVSFGASLFVDSTYIDREIEHPQPDLNSRLFGAIASGNKVVRPRGSLTSRRQEDALDLVLICSSFLQHEVDPQTQIDVGLMLPQALLHLHVGFPIKRISMETTNERMRVLAAQSGVWRMVANFPHHERALFVVTREDVFASAGFTLFSPLFQGKAPVLQLRDADKDLLCQALTGETDAQLAARMHLSLSSVKKRWASLFAHISDVMPGMLPGTASAAEGDRRGSQKRHHILGYVRNHPEELRPFRFYPSRSDI